MKNRLLASFLLSLVASAALAQKGPFGKGHLKAPAPTCVERAGKPPTCQCDVGYHAECVPDPTPTVKPTAVPTATRTATVSPTATVVPTKVPTVSPTPAIVSPTPTIVSPTPPPSGGMTLSTTGDPSQGSWAIEAKTAATGVYATFFIDGARTDEWARPFCSFGDDGAACTLGSKGAGSHQVDVELRDASTNALVDKQSQTIIEGGGGGPIPTTAPPTPLPTRTTGPQPTATAPVGPTSTPAPVPTGAPGAPTPPELPRALPNVTLPTVTGQVRSVAAGGNLQAALDAAQPGDVVELAAGATFNGNYVLKKKAVVAATAWDSVKSWFGIKAASGVVWIRSSAWGNLPPQGTRVTPADAPKMARIVGQGSEAALRWDFGASHWYVTGLDLTNNRTDTTYTNYGIAIIGMDLNGASPPTAADLPDDIVFDRLYIHAPPTGNTRRGVTANGGSFAMLDSWIEDIHEVGADNQAFGSWTASGPVWVKNNYLNSCGEITMFGGADTKIQNLVPSDITIEDNLLEWKMAWKNGQWSCKNLTELKNARRVLYRRNTFRNWWAQGQAQAFAWTVRNQSNTNPWAAVDDITFESNHVYNVDNGANWLAHDSPGSGGGPSTREARHAWKNNLIEMTNLGEGTALQFLAGAQDVSITHNTWIVPANGAAAVKLSGSPPGAPAASEQMVRFQMKDNILYIGRYGVYGDNDGANSKALDLYAPGAVFTANAMYDSQPPTGNTASSFSGHPGNFFPSSMSAVGFVDMANGNYQLSASSPYKGKATDGKDVGVSNWGALPAATGLPPPAAIAAPAKREISGKLGEER